MKIKGNFCNGKCIKNGFQSNGNAGTFSYIYQYKDHLGNIRLSYGDANDDGSVNRTARKL